MRDSASAPTILSDDLAANQADPARVSHGVSFHFVDGGQFQDFELSHSSGDLHLNNVAYFFSEQAAANRRGRGNLAVSGVGFLARHQIIRNLLVLVDIEHHDAGTEAHAIVRDLREIDHRQVRQALFELIQPGVDEALPLFGCVIFGILAEVAVGARLQNLSGQFIAQLVLQRRNLILQFFLEVGHRPKNAPTRTL